MKASRALWLVGVAALGLGLWMVGGNHLRPLIFQFAMPTNYFEPQRAKPDEFIELTDGIYAFRHGFNRSLVVDAGDTLAVFDTFDGEHARILRQVLADRFPGKPVGTVVYSHNHLDHIRGAGALSPERVIAHKDVMSHVRDFPYADDVLPVTQTIEGDTEIMIGDTLLRMLYLPRSHSETLYAAYLPDAKVLFLPDLMFKDAMPPFGFPDWYYPGYIRALDRLLAVDAAHYVPTHFDMGSREDLQGYRDMMVDFRETVVQALAKYDHDAANGEYLRAVLKEVYPVLAERHGHRIGFDAMFIPHFGGQAGGMYLGY